MLRLRQYKACDAEKIVSWIKDEETFRKWSSDRFGDFLLSAAVMNEKYFDNNGDCEDPENFFPMTAFDEDGITGHLILRFMNPEKTVLRFGFVIVDDAKRGRGYGREMLKLALDYAFNILKVEKVTLGVFENNPSALRCYKAAGFSETGICETSSVMIAGKQHNWKCIELEKTRE